MKFIVVFLLIMLAACSPYVSTPVAVSPTDTAQAASTIAASPTALFTATAVMTERVTAFTLHVRAEAGHDKPVIGYLYNHDVVTLTGRCRAGWAQIEWKDELGWVKAKYLSDNKCQE